MNINNVNNYKQNNLSKISEKSQEDSNGLSNHSQSQVDKKLEKQTKVNQRQQTHNPHRSETNLKLNKLQENLNFGNVKDNVNSNNSNKVDLKTLSNLTGKGVASLWVKDKRGKLTQDYINKRIKKEQQKTAKKVGKDLSKIRYPKAPYLGWSERRDLQKTYAEWMKHAVHKIQEDIVDDSKKTSVVPLHKYSFIGPEDFCIGYQANQQLYIHNLPKKLGGGGEGDVYQALNVINPNEKMACKISSSHHVIDNEYNILNYLQGENNGKPVTGIQFAPIHTFEFINKKHGYFAPLYNTSLDNISFYENHNLSTEQRIKEIYSLFYGLKFMHEHGVVHSDIKPSNCCSQTKEKEDIKNISEFKLADFGGARKIQDISLKYPLSSHTPKFSSIIDLREHKHIALTYKLNQLMLNQPSLLPDKVISILIECLNSGKFNFMEGDNNAIKLQIANVVIKSALNNNKINYEKAFKSYNLDVKQFENEIKILKKNKIGTLSEEIRKQEKEIPLSLSNYPLNDFAQLKLQKRAADLCKRHDVYGLGLTVLQIIDLDFMKECNDQKPLPDVQKALDSLSNKPELQKFNPKLINLLKRMLSEKPGDRPTIEEAYQIFTELLI